MKAFIFLSVYLFFIISSSVFGQRIISVPVSVKNNRTYITIKIGKHIIPDVLLDTGFAYDGLMIFNPLYRDSLDLSGAVEVQIGGAGGGDGTKALLIDSMSFFLDSIEMIDQALIILGGNSGFGSNGLTGYSIFGHYITEFDYDKNTMSLYKPGEVKVDKSWTAIPIYFKDNNIPWLDGHVVIENEKPVPVSMYIDFAAGDEILLLEKPGMKFSLPDETRETYLGRGLSGDIYGKTGTISKLIIGPFEMKDINASFADAKIRSKQKDADAILGNVSLRRFNLIFDYMNKRLYLKPNSNF